MQIKLNSLTHRADKRQVEMFARAYNEIRNDLFSHFHFIFFKVEVRK